MLTDEFPPLSAEKLAAISNPERNAPTVVSMALEIIALRELRAKIAWFDAQKCEVRFTGNDMDRCDLIAWDGKRLAYGHGSGLLEAIADAMKAAK